MRRILLGVSLLCLPAVALADDALTLSRDGKSDYVVVLPARPTPVEQTAARELQTHLAQITGATLPIVSESEVPPGAPRIVVGDAALTRKLLPALDPTRLPPDGVVLKSVGPDVVLVGHPRRGTLYAVYTLLEDVLGVRWWTPTEVHIPQRPTLGVPLLDITYAPKLIDRATRYTHLSKGVYKLLQDDPSGGRVTLPEIGQEMQQTMGVFSARLKLNGQDHYAIPAEYGGANGLVGWVHTFYSLLPPAKYFAEHPEWYSLIDGKRTHDQGQLCLTSDAMREELTRNALSRLRNAPGATIISISQNDWRGNCQCERCRAVDAEEGSPAGSLLQFVNRVAEDIEKEYPDVLVETLAYMYTRKPPQHARPRRNVVVRLCPYECSFAEPLETGEQNKRFREDIEGWSRIAPQLYIWDYVANFRAWLIPHPNLHVLAPNLRYFVRNHAIGVFEQGDSGTQIGEFMRLRAWLLAHLLWNPEADENRLVDDFLTGYYGPAAPMLRQYLEGMSQAARRSGVFLSCYMPDTTGWLTLDDLNRATRLFDQALEAVKDDGVLRVRVRRERLPLDLVWLQRYAELKRRADEQKGEFLGPADSAAALEEYLRVAKENGGGEYRQERPFSEYEPELRRSLGK